MSVCVCVLQALGGVAVAMGGLSIGSVGPLRLFFVGLWRPDCSWWRWTAVGVLVLLLLPLL